MAVRVVTKNKDGRVVKMKDMKPLQGGIIVSDGYTYKGHYVMRTQSNDVFEVMDLSDPQPGYCFTGEPDLMVRILESPITVEIDGR